MSRHGKAALAAVALVVGVCVTVLIVRPSLVVDPIIHAFGGATCDNQRCPPDAPWVRPVDAPVTSGFRTAARPDHHGADMAAARGDPVVAASSGVVTIAECQASLRGEPYGCDRDGSPEVLGCGWFVKILHADHVATLYCHLERAPEVSVDDTVTAGQLIGYVGSTGNSSEPHLHFEVQVGSTFAPPVSASAVDPEEFLAERV